MVLAAPAASRAAACEQPIRVLVCDDSAVIRGLLARLLDADPAITVVGTASNGRDVLGLQAREKPDVVVLDIEMPVMDGLAALPALLKADPGVQVVMASTLTTRGADVTMKALRLGAADYVPKPTAIGRSVAPRTRAFPAPEGGVVAAIDGRALGHAAIALGGGRRVEGDRIDPAVGLSGIVRIGDRLAAGDPLCLIHAADDAGLGAAEAELAGAFRLADSATPPPLLHERIA